MQHAITDAEVSRFINADFYTIPQTARTKTNILTMFASWCKAQEKNRFLWLGLAFLGLIGLALPCTLTAILLMGNSSFPLVVLACVINVPVLMLNLAAQSTKITLPAFFFACIADTLIILYCAGLFLLK